MANGAPSPGGEGWGEGELFSHYMDAAQKTGEEGVRAPDLTILKSATIPACGESFASSPHSGMVVMSRFVHWESEPEPRLNHLDKLPDNMKNEIIRVGQIVINFLLEAADTNGSVAMFEFTVPVGAKVPLPHSHKNYDETIYGVQGVITFIVNGKPVRIGPGESCFIPRGAVHGFNNLDQTDAKGLAVITPALLGPDFFRETAVIVNAGGPPDIEKLKAVLAKHGLVPALPQPV